MRHDEDRPLSRLDRLHATNHANAAVFTRHRPALPGSCLRSAAGGLRRPAQYASSLRAGRATHLAGRGSRRSGGRQRGVDAGDRLGRHTLSLRRQHARVGVRLQRPRGLCLSGRAGSPPAAHFPRTGPGAGSTHRTAAIGTGRPGVLRQQRQRQPCGDLRRRRPLRPRPEYRGHGSPGPFGWCLLAGPLHGRETRFEVTSGLFCDAARLILTYF